MSVLGIITARGGSKGIPNKNITKILGKTLLQYTFDVAKKSSNIDRIILSTDDKAISEHGKDLGLDVPFVRPSYLATDKSKSIDVAKHAILVLEEVGESYDYILLLQPTNPLRTVEDIDNSIKLISETNADSVISFSDVGERHPARMKHIDNNGWVINPPFAEAFEGQRRQELEPIYLRDGSIYLTKRDVIVNQNSFQGNKCQAYIIPKERAWNIDEPIDLLIIKSLMKYNEKNTNNRI